MPGRGRCGERVAGPALGAGERVECGRLGERVAGLAGQLDRLLGARVRLLYGVARRPLGGPERVREHRRLSQRQRSPHGRIRSGQALVGRTRTGRTPTNETRPGRTLVSRALADRTPTGRLLGDRLPGLGDQGEGFVAGREPGERA